MATSAAKESARARAELQGGRVSRAQLIYLGVQSWVVKGWIHRGDLLIVSPGVYAWGHRAPSELGDLWAAVLGAGPGAMLSHMTAAWWHGLIDFPAREIHVSTPRRCLSLPGVIVHGRRHCERSLHRGVPVTSIPQTMLDLAATGEVLLVRKALGRLDFRDQLDLDGLARMCRSGRPGSAVLRQAIIDHDPRFGRTNGPLEDSLVLFCERQHVPKPDRVGHWLYGIELDGYYVAARLVIQLDGHGNHHSPTQLRRDHRNDMILRGHGEQVNRYSWELIHTEPRAVRRDILESLTVRS